MVSLKKENTDAQVPNPPPKKKTLLLSTTKISQTGLKGVNILPPLTPNQTRNLNNKVNFVSYKQQKNYIKVY
jgi:hypothetical protein